MESHVLNTYHQARYGIPTRDRSSTSESYSSESSFNQNSPEYLAKYQRMTGYQKNEWNAAVRKQNFPCETKMVSSDSSSEDDSSDQPQVTEEEVVYETVTTEEVNDDYEYVVAGSDDDYEVVVDDSQEITANPPNEQIVSNEGEVIHIFAVNPDLDIDLSENEEDYCIPPGEINKNCRDYEDEEKYSRETENNLEINLDGPVVSHVDEYFIKQEKPVDSNDILVIKEHHVVSDVDEYFIKPTKTVPASELTNNDDIPASIIQTVPNVEEFFVTPKVENEKLMVEVPNVDEFFVKTEAPVTKKLEEPSISSHEDALPRIESIKRFLLEGMPGIKQSKNVQRSCSLPHSPAHLPCPSLDESKTSLSFEDLLDLSFEKDKNFDLSNAKTDDLTTTLTEDDVNSFLITDKVAKKCLDTKIDFNQKHATVAPKMNTLPIIKMRTGPPLPPPARSVLDFCIEKPIKKDLKPVKVEVDDFIDVESLNETVLPVLEATNVSSLLEQFEASEKLNNAKSLQEETPVKQNGLPNGMRLQDAALQLNKNKMRQIMISPNAAAAVKKPQTSHLDHDYCSPKKKTSIQLKGGQSLLKPEVLSSNTKILKSRHRSCKDKKVVYHLSSDDEADTKTAQNNKDPVKPSIKESLTSNHRKKVSPTPEFLNGDDKCNISVIPSNASKASDIRSQSSSGSIKLTIKNRSKVILNLDCDDKDSEKDKTGEHEKGSDSDIKPNSNSELKSVASDVKADETSEYQCAVSDNKVDSNIERISIAIDDTQSNSPPKIRVCEPKVESKRERKTVVSAKKIDHHSDTRAIKINTPQKTPETCKKTSKDTKPKCIEKKGLCEVDLNKDLNKVKTIKEEVRPNDKDFYTGLFKNKTNQITMPSPMTADTKAKIEKSSVTIKTEEDKKPQVKKLNLQEYKKRREGLHSNNISRTVSPEPIFPEMNGSIPTKMVKSLSTDTSSPKEAEPPKKVFDPIREASRKILLSKSKKKNAEALRKREDDLLMSKIPKVENLQLQPLISDAEIMKMVGMAAELAHKPVEKPKTNNAYEELVLVSVGINTDEEMLRQMASDSEPDSRKLESPTTDKSLINFKIKKSDNVLKQNVFDASKDGRRSSSVEREKAASPNRDTIDKERYKDITETLKSVGKQVDTKSGNSLFSSIQEIVMKKAPEKERKPSPRHDERRAKSTSKEKSEVKTKTVMVKDYDTKLDHGEDKVILHLERNRVKATSSCMAVQTEPTAEFGALCAPAKATVQASRKRTQSSVANEPSPPKDKVKEKSIERSLEKKHDRTKSSERLKSKERSRSRDRYAKYRSRSRRSRSNSRRLRRSRSRSAERYRRYRAGSPYRRRRRSNSDPRRQKNDYRSRSRKDSSPNAKRFKPSPEKSLDRSLTPPPRKPTTSESSASSRSSTSSSSSSSSSASSRSRSPSARAASPERAARPYRAYSQDRDDTPVEERRIVFVGRLESDATKSSLRGQFCKFGPVIEVTLHTKEDGCRYGFVTFSRARDAWAAVEAAASFPQYDVGFGGRRAFCRQRYADLDGNAEYTELARPAPRARPLSFEQMLNDVMSKLSQRRDKRAHDERP